MLTNPTVSAPRGSAIFSSGSGSWSVPAGVTTFKVRVLGPGGAGTSIISAVSSTILGGGGGSGAYSEKLYTNQVPGTSYNYSVGTPGTGSTTAPAAGTTSTFDVVSSFPGASGTVNNASAGAGGVASGGDLNVHGGSGGVGATSPGPGGAGSSSALGGGAFSVAPGAGVTAVVPGAGGSGASRSSATTLLAGGNGGPGQIIIEW